MFPKHELSVVASHIIKLVIDMAMLIVFRGSVITTALVNNFWFVFRTFIFAIVCNVE